VGVQLICFTVYIPSSMQCVICIAAVEFPRYKKQHDFLVSLIKIDRYVRAVKQTPQRRRHQIGALAQVRQGH